MTDFERNLLISHIQTAEAALRGAQEIAKDGTYTKQKREIFKDLNGMEISLQRLKNQLKTQ